MEGVNRQVTVPLGSSATGSANGSAASRPLTPHDQPIMLAAGITKLAHLQVALQQQRFFKLGTGSDWQYCIAF